MKSNSYVEKNVNETAVDLKKFLSESSTDVMNHLEKFLSNDKNFELFVPEVKKNPNLLNMFHEAYLKIKNRHIIVNEGLIRKIKIMDSLYYDLLKEQTNTSLNYNEVQKRIHDRLFEMKNRSVEGYKYREEAYELMSEDKMFSLNEMYKYREELGKQNIGMGGVTYITPLQTISRFNDAKDGIIGAGLHGTKINKIIKVVYGEEFNSIDALSQVTGQDIRIFHSNFNDDPSENTIMVVIYLPAHINSFQKRSLELFNKEIKKYEEKNSTLITISWGAFDYDKNLDLRTMSGEGYNLDELLERIPVDDSILAKYHDQYLVGHENYINHYNDSDFKINIPVLSSGKTPGKTGK